MGDNKTYASVFCVWNNPRTEIIYKHDEEGNILLDDDGNKIILRENPTYLYSLSEQEICDIVLKTWCDSSPGRIGAVVYCVSATGLHHLHMVLEVHDSDSKRFRFSAVKKLYPKAHIEPTRGNKQEAEDYINKVGKYAEKDEIVLAKAQIGELSGNKGNRSDLKSIGELIDSGMSPNEIYDLSISNRRFDKYIKCAYFRKRLKETPFVRDVKVVYHCGVAGSGKSLAANSIVDSLGYDSIYFVTDYSPGWIDNYNGEPILWLDEFQGQFSYSTLKTLIDRYLGQVHARYSNVYTLWNEVHITSIYPIEELYNLMVPRDKWRIDTIDQLKRRITDVCYHYVENGVLKSYTIPMSEYYDYASLKRAAMGEYTYNGFYKADSSEQIAFKT